LYSCNNIYTASLDINDQLKKLNVSHMVKVNYNCTGN